MKRAARIRFGTPSGVHRVLWLAALMFSCAAVASAGTLTGVVRNGTTGKPAPGLDVILIQLQGGMQPVATTKSDADGRYMFDRPELSGAPMLVRVPYRGVNYHEPVPPGALTADVQVFEPTQDPKTITVTQHAIVFEPKDSALLVGEEYSITNQTKPPVAYYRTDGTFEFHLPAGAQLNQVSAWSASKMPLVQGTIDKGKDTLAVAFPFRPGENGVRLSYQMPYPSNQVLLHNTSPYAAARVLLVAPPGVQVLSAGFEPAGTQEGYNFLARDSVRAGTQLDISVSGAAAPASATATATASGEGQESANSRTGAEPAHVLPAQLDGLKWILIGGFALLFVLGVGFLWRKPQRAVAAEPKSAVLAETDRAVKGGLDEIKDSLFKLELRRQAGTISEEEYTRQRGRAEKFLRDLVKG
jgi:hypothetical protein